MNLRTRFYLAFVSSFIAIGIHLVASDLYLYWTYKQIDILVHIIGGIMAGFYVLVGLRYVKFGEIWRNLFWGVLVVGIGWEVLELFYKVDNWDAYYALDTFKDLIDDLIGGYIALRVWRRLPEPTVH